MKYSLREAYGKALVELGQKDGRIVSLDGDLGKSTFARSLIKLDPRRYIEVGIAEQNMAGIAAGLALAGKCPFYSSFAVFATGRAYDQIRSSICIPRLNVNICGSSAGLSDYGDGKTHQSIDDIALMTALPSMTVLSPLDANQVRGMVEAMVNKEGPGYIRIPRNDLPLLATSQTYKIGQIDQLKKGGDGVVVTTGGPTHEVVKAAEELEGLGISVSLLHLGTLKPFPFEEFRGYVEPYKYMLILEEHSVIGGLGSLVKGALAGHPMAIEHMGINDSFGQSASSYEELVEFYGLSWRHIVEKMKSLMDRR